MESSELRDLLDYLAKINFVEFEMEKEGFRLRLVRAFATEPQPSTLQAGVVPAIAAALPTGAAAAALAVDDGLFVVTSPIVGTFYRSATPDTPSFAEVGGRVKKGQVLCIVEAMKLMNEIESDIEGEIVDVLVANGQPVEYGEVLFRIRPIG